MILSIEQQLVSLISDVIPLNLSECTSDSYPYAVYTCQVVSISDKSGPIAYEGECIISLFDETFARIDEKAAAIRSALDGGQGGFYAVFQSQEKTCNDAVFCIEIKYKLIQLS